MPKQVYIRCFNNVDFGINFQITRNGLPADLTGFTAHMQVRLNGSLLLDATTENDHIALSNDFVMVNFAVDDVEDLPITSALYDLYLTNQSGVTYMIAFGIFEIREGQTHE